LLVAELAILMVVFLGSPLAAWAQPVVTLSVNDDSAAESGQDPASLTVRRTDDGNLAASLAVWITVGGTAQANGDYTFTNLGFASAPSDYVVVIPGGELARSVTLTPRRDNIAEGTESVTFNVRAPGSPGSDYLIGTPSAAGFSIADDVTVVRLTVDDADADEAGQDTARFTVFRDDGGDTDSDLAVWVTVGGSALLNSDYTLMNLAFASGPSDFRVTIPRGELSQTVTLTPRLDNIAEGVEDFTFDIRTPGTLNNDYVIGPSSSGSAFIADDVAQVTLAVGEAGAVELDQSPGSFVVTRDGGGDGSRDLVVWITVEGTALIGTDYTVTDLAFGTPPSNYRLTIPGGTLSRTVTVTPIADDVDDGGETAGFTLAPPGSLNNDYTFGPSTEAFIFFQDVPQTFFRDGFETAPADAN
jgi:hypothetical protein